MKLLKTFLCCIIAAILLTACGKENEPASVFIDPPDLPDYSEYFDLGPYTGIKYTLAMDYKVTDQEVQRRLEDKLAAAAEFNEVTDRGAVYGDTVQIVYTGTVDGKPFDGGSTDSSGVIIEIGGEDYMTAGFEFQLCNMKKGDTKTITVTFPRDYGNEELNSKQAEFNITMLSIIESKLPEITDELVSKYTDYKTVEDAKLDIKASLDENMAKAKRESCYNRIIASIITNSEYKTYPEDEINSLIETAVLSAERNAAANGMFVDDYLKQTGTAENMDEFKTVMETQAQDYLNTRMTMCEIARRENITATPEEFTKYKTEFAQTNGFETVQDVNLYYKDEDLLIDCLYQKIKDWLIDNSPVDQN